jgi:hypothetical protein
MTKGCIHASSSIAKKSTTTATTIAFISLSFPGSWVISANTTYLCFSFLSFLIVSSCLFPFRMKENGLNGGFNGPLDRFEAWKTVGLDWAEIVLDSPTNCNQ